MDNVVGTIYQESVISMRGGACRTQRILKDPPQPQPVGKPLAKDIDIP